MPVAPADDPAAQQAVVNDAGAKYAQEQIMLCRILLFNYDASWLRVLEHTGHSDAMQLIRSAAVADMLGKERPNAQNIAAFHALALDLSNAADVIVANAAPGAPPRTLRALDGGFKPDFIQVLKVLEGNAGAFAKAHEKIVTAALGDIGLGNGAAPPAPGAQPPPAATKTIQFSESDKFTHVSHGQLIDNLVSALGTRLPPAQTPIPFIVEAFLKVSHGRRAALITLSIEMQYETGEVIIQRDRRGNYAEKALGVRCERELIQRGEKKETP